jgi:hypothetical protein
MRINTQGGEGQSSAAFSADRIILSPFTKEYRVGDALLRLLIEFFAAILYGWLSF